jgi:hypothetical protein
MEGKKKTNFKRFKFIFYLLVIIFVCLYFAGKTGYYENKISSSSRLTKEAILEFEKDVAEGKAVDLKDYVKQDNNDYKNAYSNLGYKVSESIDTILTDGVSYVVKILKTLFS